MTSREEFMRQLGLSANDLVTPPETKPTTRRTRPVIDDDEDEVPRYAPSTKGASASPAPAMPAASAKQAATSGQSAQSRSDFLRSLGIDNADHGPVAPEAAAATSGASRNATGSQEIPRAPFRQTSGNARPVPAKVTQIIRESEEESSFCARPAAGSPLKPSADITLGPKPAIQKAPTTPGLDAELKGMSDAAGAEEVKAMGNKFFQAGDYRKAVRLYTRAIELDPTNAALYSNRSAAYLLGGKQMGIDTRSMALRDGDKCVKLKPSWFKGYSRRGDALFKLERYPEACEAYEAALEIDPGNNSIMHSLNELRPYVQKKNSTEAASWSAPGSAILSSSVASGSMAKPATNKSAHDLLDEFTRERERTTPQLGRGGNDYKATELERFRTRRTGDSSGTFESEGYDKSPSATQESDTPSGSGAYKTSALPSEFSSDAARDYQAQLLENYRKKKAAQQSGRR